VDGTKWEKEKNCDKVAGPSGLAVISLQKEDSLLVLASLGEAKRFLRWNAGGIWIEIHLNLKINDSLKLISYSRG